MTDGPTPHELSERIARLEEAMKTMKAEYETGLARLEAKIAEAKVTVIVATLGIVGLAVALLKFG